MTRAIDRVPKKNNQTITLLKTIARLERQNAHQRTLINSQADQIIDTELLRKACIDNHQLLQTSREQVLELEADKKEWQEEMAEVNQENLRLREEIQNATSTADDLRKRMKLLEQEICQLRKQGEIRERVVTIKKEIEEENEEIAKPDRTKPTSYLYEAKNGAVPQVVKEASAAHYYYLGRISKRENYIRWSQLEKANKKMWTEEWAKMRKVQKEQAAQGLIILRTQIKEEVKDEAKWTMTLRRRN